MVANIDLPEPYKIEPPAKYKPIDFKKRFNHFFVTKRNPQQVFNDIQTQSFYLRFALPIFKLYPPILGLEEAGFPKKIAKKLEDMSTLGDFYGAENFIETVQKNIPNLRWEKYKDKILDIYFDGGMPLLIDGYSGISMVDSFCIHDEKEELAQMYSPNPLQPLIDEFYRKESFILNVFINKLENDALFKKQIKKFGTLKFHPEFMDTKEVIAWFRGLTTYIKRFFPSKYRDSFYKLDDEMAKLEKILRKVSQKVGHFETVGRKRKLSEEDKKEIKSKYIELVSNFNELLEMDFKHLVHRKKIGANSAIVIKESVNSATFNLMLKQFCTKHYKEGFIYVKHFDKLKPRDTNTSNKLIKRFLAYKYKLKPSYFKQILKV